MVLNGKLKSARYLANVVSQTGEDNTHIWLKFTYHEDKDLIVFVYRSGKRKNILYPHAACLAAEIAIGDELYYDIKHTITRQKGELSNIDIIIGASGLTESLLEQWLSSGEDAEEDEGVAIEELSFIFEHPTYAEE